MAVVLYADTVVKKGQRSNGRVLEAVRVQQKRCNANGRISSPLLLNTRDPAPTPVLVAACIAKERIPTNCAVFAGAGGEAKDAVLPFCRVEVRITSIRRRDDCLHRG